MKLGPRPTIEKLTNLYTLIVQYGFFPCHIRERTIYATFFSPNNTYDVWLDGEPSKTGSLLEDFEPPVNPPREIDDPEDKKPADWVDQEKIPDPDAKKVCISRLSYLLSLMSITAC